MALNWFSRIRRPQRRSLPPEERYNPLSPHTTEAFERHIGIIDLTEASKRSPKAQPRGPKNLSMAWDDTSLGGLGSRDLVLDDWQKKDTYYKVYCGNQWVSGCVDVIAKRMTSGGWECVEVKKGKGKKSNQQRIESVLDLENLEEDPLQLLRSIATDLGIFGESFCELGFGPDGYVDNLYMIDSATMITHFDRHGIVTGYTQRLEKSTDTVTFEPHEIVRWWFPDPKAKKKALSPIERLKDPVWLDRSMTTWGERFFRQGGKPSYWVEMGPDSDEGDGDRYIEWYKENYTGLENAHIPPVMYAGSKIHEFGTGSIELDFDKSDNKQRDRVLVVYGVPPAMLNIIESGNLGGGTGESQNKGFLYNTVGPIEQLVMEKFNYRVIKRGMAIDDWKVQTRHADYRDDKEITDIEDKQINNGTLSRNEARQGRGRNDVPGGDTLTITTGNVITPVARLETLEAEQAQQAQLSMQAMQQGQGGGQDDKEGEEPGDGQEPAQQDGNEHYAHLLTPLQEATINSLIARTVLDERRFNEANWTGVMVGFFLKPSEARALVLPDGEAIDDLHMTLAFLGDRGGLGSAAELKRTVATYAEGAPLLQGQVSGIGRFTSVPPGEPTPVYASVDSPGLPEWRQSLVKALSDAGFAPNAEHGFTPHVALAYVNASAPMPVEKVPAIGLNFDLLWLAIGDERYAYALKRGDDGQN